VAVVRKLTIRDLLATLIVAAVVVPFAGYSARGSMPFVHDPRGMAAVGVAGGVLAFAVLGRKAFGAGTFQRIMGHLAVITLGCGIAALFGETSWALLILLTAGIVIMWALALAHDAGYLAPDPTARHA
jgi:hypothetical protein